MLRSSRRARLGSVFTLLPLLFCSATVGAQVFSPQPQQAEPILDPASPMAELPDIGVAWPTMEANQNPSAQQVAPEKSQSEDGERRYSVELVGLEKIPAAAIFDRFAALSALKLGEGKPANTAQIDRRAREDRDLLEQILRTAGYYDAQIDAEVENGRENKLLVRFSVTPGPLYRFQNVTVDGLDSTNEKGAAFSKAFGVGPQDAVDADAILAGRQALEKSLKDSGYPFAKVAEPEIVIDHDTLAGNLSMKVESGGVRRFGEIRVQSENPPFGAKHVATIARFRAGQPYDQTRIDDLRRALVATGIVGAVDIKPVPGKEGDTADIEIGLEPAPLRTIAGELGYGTGEGLRAEVSWTHRNLIKPEGAVTLRAVIGTREQAGGIVLRQSNFRRRDHVLNARLSVSNINRQAFNARTVEVATNLERQSNIIWQKRWTWSVGSELIATDEQDVTSGGLGTRQTYFVGALPLSVGYDRSDDLLDPTKGFRLSLRVSPELSLRGRAFGYLRGQIDGSAYFPAGDRIVLAGRIRVGTIIGASAAGLAPSRRFYSGGGGSVRGFGYQSIGPRDAFNDPTGGRSLAEFALEARFRFGDFGIVPFIDGGNIYSRSTPSLKGFRYGAGLGARYHSSFGPIRIDIGTPINPRKGDSPVTIFVSLGQAF
jgi:translocation and assembly module TamA